MDIKNIYVALNKYIILFLLSISMVPATARDFAHHNYPHADDVIYCCPVYQYPEYDNNNSLSNEGALLTMGMLFLLPFVLFAGDEYREINNHSPFVEDGFIEDVFIQDNFYDPFYTQGTINHPPVIFQGAVFHEEIHEIIYDDHLYESPELIIYE